MAQRAKITGFRELDRALSELPKATERGVLRNVAKKALQPMLEDAQDKAPVDDGQLRDSLQISATGLTKKAKRQDRGRPKKGARMYLGTASPYAALREFGTVQTPATPFLRPAFDSNVKGTIEIIRRELREEIDKAARRVARKARRSGK